MVFTVWDILIKIPPVSRAQKYFAQLTQKKWTGVDVRCCQYEVQEGLNGSDGGHRETEKIPRNPKGAFTPALFGPLVCSENPRPLKVAVVSWRHLRCFTGEPLRLKFHFYSHWSHLDCFISNPLLWCVKGKIIKTPSLSEGLWTQLSFQIDACIVPSADGTLCFTGRKLGWKKKQEKEK